MRESWTKYLLSLAGIAVLAAVLYGIYTMTPAGKESAPGVSSALEALDGQLPEFDFYKFLPESEELITPPEPGSLPAPGVADPWQDAMFQVGAYQDEREANRRRAEMILLNLPVRIERTRISGQDWHRLRIGPVEEDDFERIRQRLADHNIEYFLSRPKSP
ncbi:MAG: SPOR domain-containing protein [Gammaproteobacteria bacterium]|nr:SPOR domain-containing protein [Pseudomonadota bacterium]MCH9664150.1 SPOR domain-containing protein [Gammaproteobacteria bacterium]